MLEDPEFALACQCRRVGTPGQSKPPHHHPVLPCTGVCAGLREFKLRLAQNLAVGKSMLHRAVVPGDDMQTVTHKVLQSAVSALANLERHVDPAGTGTCGGAHRQGTAGGLLRCRQCLHVHGQRCAGAFRASRHHFRRVFRWSSAIDFGRHHESPGRRAGNLVRWTGCAVSSMQWKWQRNRAR